MKTSGSRQIAARYVKALFSVAQDARDAVEKDLLSLGQAVKSSEDFRRFLHHPLLTREQQAKAMAAILDKIDAHDVTRKFIAMLAHKRRLAILPEAVELYRQRAREARGEIKAELIAPAPLNVRVVDQVAERLGHAYGKKVILTMRQDPSLLGGVIVKIGSRQLDSSLAGKMRRLANLLKAA